VKSKPVYRAALPFAVGDSHDRVRSLEAAQTMPYWCSTVGIVWGASQALWGTTTELPVFFEESISGSMPTSLYTFNTDEEVFVPGVYGTDSYSLYVYNAGLFIWQVVYSVTTSLGFGPYTASFRAQWEPVANSPEANSAYQQNSVAIPAGGTAYISFQGMFSYDGYQGNMSTGGTQYATTPRELSLVMYKDVAADQFSVRVDAYVARLTPVGIFEAGGE
jgi:hypothetical protein